jgi:hypothetical protein
MKNFFLGVAMFVVWCVAIAFLAGNLIGCSGKNYPVCAPHQMGEFRCDDSDSRVEMCDGGYWSPRWQCEIGQCHVTGEGDAWCR